MRRVLVGLALTAILTISPFASVSAAVRWTTYRNTDFGFTIEVPVQPEVTRAQSGVSPSLQGIMLLQKENLALVFTAVDWSSARLDFSPDKMVEQVLNGALSNSKFIKDSETAITKWRYIGRDVTAHRATENLSLRMRISYHNKHVVATSCIKKGGFSSTTLCDKYTHSLAFLP